MSTINIFADSELHDFLQEKLERLKKEIHSATDDYILNTNETQYIDYLVGIFSLDVLTFDFDNVFITTEEREIPGELFPDRGFRFELRQGQRYTKDVITYHIPFEGPRELLRCIPRTRIVWTTSVTVEHHSICFEIINFYNDANIIKNEADHIISNLKKQVANIKQDIENYNSSLHQKAQEIFQSRKQHILTKHDLLAALGVPIKKRDDLPQTFSIPTPATRKKIQIAKPHVMETGYIPEPTLEQATYEEILQNLHDWGKQFERMPSTYSNKEEEDLRDLFLVFVEPYFVGTATGETFNKSGKTDILLRYEGKNVFIAEFKFWKGQKAYLSAITQLLGYLTWRDSKAALVMFVINKDFTSVIQTVESVTPTHENFLGFIDKRDDTWLNYRIHFHHDENREVRLAVLLFHIPSTD